MAEEVHHHHYNLKDGDDPGVADPVPPKPGKRKLGLPGVGSQESTPEGDVQIPKGALYRLAAAMKFDLDAKNEGGHEQAVMERLSSLVKEHGDFKTRLADVEAKHAETEAKRAKADVTKLVTLKAIAADEKTVAGVIKLRKTDPELFETLYGGKLAGTERVTTPAVDQETLEARLLLSHVAPNGGTPRRPLNDSRRRNDAGDADEGETESPHARATKIMKDNKNLTYGAALTAASRSLKAESRNRAAGAR